METKETKRCKERQRGINRDKGDKEMQKDAKRDKDK